jgi:hypothetical protein
VTDIGDETRVRRVREKRHWRLARDRRESPKGSDAFAAMVVHFETLAG